MDSIKIKTKASKDARRSTGSQICKKQDNITVEKMRAMSTSTPVINHYSSRLDFLPPVRSLSASLCSSINDSGYADSFMDSECSGYDPCDTTLGSDSCDCVQHVDEQFQLSTCLSPFDERFNLDRTINDSEENIHGKDWEVSHRDDIYDKAHSTPLYAIPKYSLRTDSDSILKSDSGFCGLIEKFEQVLTKFSPKEPDRLIGRKMGLKYVDILGELINRNMESVVKVILGSLHPADLCRVVQVNKTWKSACECNTVLQKRRLEFLEKERCFIPGKEYNVASAMSDEVQTVNKENIGKHMKKRQSRGLTDAGDRKFAAVQCVGSEENFQNGAYSHLQEDLFKQAASGLKTDEMLKKCPKCQCPAKVLPVQDRGQCHNVNCLFDFCVKCFYEFHGARPCIPVASKRTKTDSIGGKKSKKNLKRL